jgi:hypothetical protein
MVNKRGQQMTLGTIISIVLGVTVLVFLVFGFSTGWSSMWDQIAGRTTGSNVNVKIADCDNDCSADERTSWCFEKKTLRFISEEGKIVKVEGSCDQFEDGILDEKYNEYNTVVSGLGFNDCDFDCSSVESSTDLE